MMSLRSILSLAHLIGLALAVGAASVKAALLLRSKADRAFLPTYLAVERPVTRLIRAERRYHLIEAAATGTFYVIIVMWVLG